MIRRLTMTALLAAGIAAPATAEPLKAPAPPAAQAPAKAAVLLAASEIRAPDQQTDGQAAAPAKRPRAARVTSCRCAGQTPQQP